MDWEWARGVFIGGGEGMDGACHRAECLFPVFLGDMIKSPEWSGDQEVWMQRVKSKGAGRRVWDESVV